MIRVIKMSGKWFGLAVDKIDEDEADNIKQFCAEGNPVIIVADLKNLRELGIDPDGVEMVE